MRLYRVEVHYGVTTETVMIRARSLDESFSQAIQELKDRGIVYGKIDGMSSIFERKV